MNHEIQHEPCVKLLRVLLPVSTVVLPWLVVVCQYIGTSVTSKTKGIVWDRSGASSKWPIINDQKSIFKGKWQSWIQDNWVRVNDIQSISISHLLIVNVHRFMYVARLVYIWSVVALSRSSSAIKQTLECRFEFSQYSLSASKFNFGANLFYTFYRHVIES